MRSLDCRGIVQVVEDLKPEMATLPLPIQFRHLRMSILPSPKRYYVYAAYDGGEIVYVGTTAEMGKRIGHHRYCSKWCTPEITFGILSEHLQEAYDVEKETISRLQPKFNITHNPNRKSVRTKGRKAHRQTHKGKVESES